MDTELTHCRHDRSHCLAPGLFRSLKKGERKKQKLDVSYSHGSEVVRFIGFEPLGADDLRLLQGIVALSGPEGVLLTPTPSAESPKTLRRLLEITGGVEPVNALMVTAHVGRLLVETGMTDGGKNIKILKASLVRLSNVTVIASRGEKLASFRLLSFYFDGLSGQLHVALNPRLADAVVGSQHARIELSEVRKLKSDAARLIHQRLCGFVNHGKSHRVNLDSLCGYVWPEESGSEAGIRQRRSRVRKALREIVACGWGVREYAHAKFEFRRPPLPGRPA